MLMFDPMKEDTALILYAIGDAISSTCKLAFFLYGAFALLFLTLIFCIVYFR